MTPSCTAPRVNSSSSLNTLSETVAAADSRPLRHKICFKCVRGPLAGNFCTLMDDDVIGTEQQDSDKIDDGELSESETENIPPVTIQISSSNAAATSKIRKRLHFAKSTCLLPDLISTVNNSALAMRYTRPLLLFPGSSLLFDRLKVQDCVATSTSCSTTPCSAIKKYETCQLYIGVSKREKMLTYSGAFREYLKTYEISHLMYLFESRAAKVGSTTDCEENGDDQEDLFEHFRQLATSPTHFTELKSTLSLEDIALLECAAADLPYYSRETCGGITCDVPNDKIYYISWSGAEIVPYNYSEYDNSEKFDLLPSTDSEIQALLRQPLPVVYEPPPSPSKLLFSSPLKFMADLFGSLGPSLGPPQATNGGSSPIEISPAHEVAADHFTPCEKTATLMEPENLPSLAFLSPSVARLVNWAAVSRSELPSIAVAEPFHGNVAHGLPMLLSPVIPRRCTVQLLVPLCCCAGQSSSRANAVGWTGSATTCLTKAFVKFGVPFGNDDYKRARVREWLDRVPEQCLVKNTAPLHRQIIRLPASFGAEFHLSVRYQKGQFVVRDTFPDKSLEFSPAADVRLVQTAATAAGQLLDRSKSMLWRSAKSDHLQQGGCRLAADQVERVWLNLARNKKYCLHYGDILRSQGNEYLLSRWNVGVAGLKGHRVSMEDEETVIHDLGIFRQSAAPVSFYAVYDGHGGRECAGFIQNELHLSIVNSLQLLTGEEPGEAELRKELFKALRYSFLSTDRAFIRGFRNQQTSSSTGRQSNNGPGGAAVIVIVLNTTLWCANVGDARAVLCRDGEAVELSVDHKPDRPDEAKRIAAAGGIVRNRRVLGRLAVSRAFGDKEYKNYSGNGFQALVIAEPEVHALELDMDKDEFLILACDGLFDVFTSQEAVDFVRPRLFGALDPVGDLVQESVEPVDLGNTIQQGDSSIRESTSGQKSSSLKASAAAEAPLFGNPQRVAQALAAEAIEQRQSRDNVSVILVVFKDKFG